MNDNLNLNDLNTNSSLIQNNSTVNVGDSLNPSINHNNNHQNHHDTTNKIFNYIVNNRNKMLIILSVFILILSVIFFTKFLGSNSNLANMNFIFDPDRPISIEIDGKYGYITSDGKMMIEPQYIIADDFIGKYAIVAVENPDKESSSEVKYQIIDKKGNVIVIADDYSTPKYYSSYGIWVINDGLYDSNLKRIGSEKISVDYIDYGYLEYSDRTKGETGIMTYKGKKIFTVPGRHVSASISENEYGTDDLYASVRIYGEDDKEVVVSLKTGDVLYESKDVENYYIFEEENGILGYYNHNLEDGYKNRRYLFFINNKLVYESNENMDELEVYDYQNQILEIDYGYDYDELGKEQRKYYYDVKNKKMLDTAPNVSNEEFNNNLIEQLYGFKKHYESGKYGLMSNEKIIIPCKYDDIEYVNINLFTYMKSYGSQLVVLEDDDKSILYDVKKSKPVITFDTTDVYDYLDSTFLKVSLYNSDKSKKDGYMIYNVLTGKSMKVKKGVDVSIGSNYVILEDDNKDVYYNTKLEQIYVLK